MTFPAWFAFHRHPALRRAVVANSVYSEMILRNAFFSPVEVKGWAWAETLDVERRNLWRAINLLVSLGFLVEHPRAHTKSPRRFTIALNVGPIDT